MKKCTLWTLLLLSSCSTKTEVTEEEKKTYDSITAIKQTSNDEETKREIIKTDFPLDSLLAKEIVKIDFPLDSLLSFDSETELQNVFGDKVKRSTGYYPEGMGEYPNTLLFPETKNEVEFVWLDDSITFSGLAYINLSGQGTDWKTQEGITLGTKLKELEELNQKPFTFYGFEWDYSGMTNWNNGHLYNRKVFVHLGYPGETIPLEFEGLLGDHEIGSDSELAQKANPVVCEITMRR